MRWQHSGLIPYLSLLPMLDQDDRSGGAGNGDDDDSSNDDADTSGGKQDSGDQSDGDNDKRLTQAEVDAIVEKRLKRAKRQWETDAEQARAKEQMDESERLRAEKQEAEDAANARVQAANDRAVRAETKAIAAELGVKPERIQYAVKLCDLSDIDVSDDGEPDSAAIKVQLEAVTKDMPELIGGGTRGGAGGSNPANGADWEPNPWSKNNWNMTEQGRIYREDPAKADRLKKAAKG